MVVGSNPAVPTSKGKGGRVAPFYFTGPGDWTLFFSEPKASVTGSKRATIGALFNEPRGGRSPKGQNAGGNGVLIQSCRFHDSISSGYLNSRL